MAVIFITHDMGVIAQICREVLVMYAGWAVESAPVKTLFNDPKHPYTRGLLKSMPHLESERKTMLPTIEGAVPSLHALPKGCRFQSRCPSVMDVCKEKEPPPVTIGENHWTRCFLY
jgi:peptide/nickel transport system ATP-binding protein